MASIPYLTGKVTYGFVDVGARNFTNYNPKDVVVSIPASELSRIVTNLEDMHTKGCFKNK